MQTTQEAVTRSIWGAAYLITQKVKLLRVLPDGGRKLFVFDNTGNQAGAALNTFHTENPQVPIHLLSETYRELQAQMHAPITPQHENKE